MDKRKQLFSPGPKPSGLKTWVIWTGLGLGSVVLAALIAFSMQGGEAQTPATTASSQPQLPSLADIVSTRQPPHVAPRTLPAAPTVRPQVYAAPTADPPAQAAYAPPPAPMRTPDPPPTENPAQAEATAAARADSVWFAATPAASSATAASESASTVAYGGARTETPAPGSLWLRDGALIPAVMQSSIDSTLAGGYVKAIVSSAVWDSLHNAVVIPPGSWLFGKVASSQGDNQTRLAIEWSELQYADGKTIYFDSSEPEVDRAGTNGVGATVDQHMGQVVKRILLTSVFVGAAGAIPSNGCSGGFGCSQNVGTGIAAAAAANIASAGADLVRSAILRPTSHVSEGQPIALMIVHGPIAFPAQ